LGPAAHGLIKHGELLTHVPVGQDQVQSALADQVDHRDIFGQPQGVVEGRHQGSQVDANVLGSGCDGGSQRDR